MLDDVVSLGELRPAGLEVVALPILPQEHNGNIALRCVAIRPVRNWYILSSGLRT